MNPAFESFYEEKWGSEWASIRNSLIREKCKVARLTKVGLAGFDATGMKESEPGLGFDPQDKRVLQSLEQSPGSFYLMDPASILVAAQLDSTAAQSVWDMCSAPGGKLLCLLEQNSENCSFVATDLSRARIERTKRVVSTYFDSVTNLRHLKLVATDAINWGYRHQNTYDRILLDAPCSSEQHVMEDPRAMKQWTMARARSLPKRQYALLCSGLLASIPGGQIVYSTCSVNPDENDGVIQRYLKKKDDAEVLELNLPVGRKTEFGILIMPHECAGWGPMYVAKLRKVPC